MTRIIAFVLRAGGAVGGAFAGLQMPPEVLTDLLAHVGLGADAGVTPLMAGMALAAVGLVFGLLLGSAVAGVLPEDAGEAVGTREDAAASVPRLRRHLADGQGLAKKAGSPLDRLSDPPAGQRLPKHDLSNIPPAPKGDEITFERIPNTGFYADIESPVKFDDQDEDLARFALPREDARLGTKQSSNDDWGSEDEWSLPSEAAPDAPSRPAPGKEQRAGISSHEQPASADARPNEFAEPPVDIFNDDAEPFDAPIAEEPAAFKPEQVQSWAQPAEPAETARVYSLQRDTGHDGHSAPRFAPGLTGGMESDWFAGEADEEEDADDDGAGYGSLMAIGLGKTHKARPQAPTHRPGEANLSPMPLLDADRGRQFIPNGAGPQDFRLREALEELKRV